MRPDGLIGQQLSAVGRPVPLDRQVHNGPEIGQFTFPFANHDRRDLETEQDAKSAADRFARRMSGAVSERLQARPDSKRKVVLLAFDLEERLIGFVRKQLVVGSSRLQNA